MPDSWRFTKLCNLVHNFSIEIVRKRRAELKQKEVGSAVCIYLLVKKMKCQTYLYCRQGERTFSFHLKAKEGNTLISLIFYCKQE